MPETLQAQNVHSTHQTVFPSLGLNRPSCPRGKRQLAPAARVPPAARCPPRSSLSLGGIHSTPSRSMRAIAPKTRKGLASRQVDPLRMRPDSSRKLFQKPIFRPLEKVFPQSSPFRLLVSQRPVPSSAWPPAQPVARPSP